MAKNPLIAKIGLGIIKGLPVIRTIKELIKPGTVSGTVTIEGKPTEVTLPAKRPDWKEVLVEVLTVGLILAFVFGKISIQDLQTLLGLVK